MNYSLFLLLILIPSISTQEITKRVRIINWYTNASELAAFNEEFPDVVFKESETLGFLCKSPYPASIHLVRDPHVDACINRSPPITSCPNPEGFFTLNLEKYEPGPYYVTSYSNREDDGKDEKEGGFCREGLIFDVNIVSGKAPDFDSQENKEIPMNMNDTAQVESIKGKLDLKKVNEINRQYVESHHLDVESDIVDEGGLEVADLEKIDEEEAFAADPYTNPPPTSTTRPPVPSHKLLVMSIPFGLTAVVAVLAILKYRRGLSHNQNPFYYTNLVNEINMQDLAPI